MPISNRNNIYYTPPRLHRPSLLRRFLVRLLIILAMYTLINLATVRYRVQGVSMQPHIAHDEFLLINRLHYLVNTPERYDVVVFRYPRDTTQSYVKRIVGLPHEVVEIRNTQVYINGTLLEETYLSEPCHPRRCANGVWQLGVDEYFVLGDNRNHSQDLRTFGAVPFRLFMGEVVLRYYPMDAIGWMTTP